MRLRKRPKKNGFSLVSVIVAAALAGIVAPVIGNLLIQQAVVRIRALNLQKADLKASQWALASMHAGEPRYDIVPEGCEVTTDAEEDVEPDLQVNVWTITCQHGSRPRVRQTAAANATFYQQDFYGLNDVDDNRDGYLDETGLPTHYQSCYAGFKGPDGPGGSGDFSKSCDIGEEPYVIPLYAHLYE